MEKRKLDNLIPNHHLIFKVLKNKTEAMDAISIYSRTFVQNVLPVKNTLLPEISSKKGEKAFLVSSENKMLLQAIKIL